MNSQAQGLPEGERNVDNPQEPTKVSDKIDEEELERSEPKIV